MINQTKISHNGVEIKILCDTEQQVFTLFNVFDTNKKGNSRATFTFYKSHDIELCKNVCNALLIAIKQAGEILKT